ncbi:MULTISPECIES: trehalose-phosphatase [unclassified Caulobacter]|uniref:trehalose-phosphatase n=1 Tax=unclassified Caulobacter TaxID=2648921 RepID=UPI0007824B07|nr:MULTISPECIES: trehalose-phosphatase [unclassified Caulobacter]AZS21878.1 trehalose-phosphatase [Caulobacter sp. FWC26]
MTVAMPAARTESANLPTPPGDLPRRAALFLDLDGTLAPIMPRPDDVGPDPARARLLSLARERLNGRVAVVSGRSLPDLDHILSRGVPAIGAVHGLVRRSADGIVTTLEPHPGLEDARRILGELAHCDRGLLFEDKALSVALHYRNAPNAAEAVIEAAERLSRATGLILQLGDMVAELRTPGADKGAAVAAFLREPPFLGATPIFVGDDLTDEDGFAAAERLGGFGVLVGEPRPTTARYRLSDTRDVSRWLQTLTAPVTA